MHGHTIKAAAYCRYSSDNQREESIEAQARAIREYAAKNGYHLSKIYIDEAKSATTDNRPEFLRMIKDCSLNIYDAIIVHKLDRFSRDRYDSAYYKRHMKKYGVRLVSVLENIDDSPESIILESVLEGMAEYYSRNLAREVMKGLKETAYKCKHTGGCPPLGYSVKPDKTYEINEQEAEIIRLIFKLYFEGLTYSNIIEALNIQNHKTRTGRQFCKNSLYDILRNEKYSGVYVFNRTAQKLNGKRNGHKHKDESEIIKVPGGMPEIISREMWEGVQAMMDKKKNYSEKGRCSSKETYLLSGLIFCGSCGGAMIGNRKYAGRNKTLYVSYECNSRKRRKNCSMKPINKSFVEDLVIEYMEQHLFSEKGVSIVADKVCALADKLSSEIPADINRMSSELMSVNTQIGNMVDAIANGMFHPSMKDRMDALENKKSELTLRIEEARRQLEMETKPSRDAIINYLRKDAGLKNKSLDEQKSTIQTYVKKVVVFDGPANEDRKVKIHLVVATDGGDEPLHTVATISIAHYRHS